MKWNYLLYSLVFMGLTACGFLKPEHREIELLRKPYLQLALSDSLTVLWRTDEGSKCKLRYSVQGTDEWFTVEGLTRPTNTGVVENEVRLRKLAANVRYDYQIFTEQTRLLPTQHLWFRAPAAASDTTFTFFAVGDVGEPVTDGGTPDVLAQALEPHIDSLQFGLLLGDIIYPDGKSEDYDANLFQYFGGVFPYLPLFTVLGNHDWHEPDENYVKEWKLPGNEHYYSFDYGHVHFVGLDTHMGEVLYDDQAQLAWLEDDLSKLSEDQQWIIVFLHHNGKSCTYKKDYEAVLGLYPLFEKYGVDLVLNGHAHTYERLHPMNGVGEVVTQKAGNTSHRYHKPEGFLCITAGSGGKLRGIGSDPKPFTPAPDDCRHPGLVAAFSHTWAFLKLEIDGRTLKGTAIATENQVVVDEFEICK